MDKLLQVLLDKKRWRNPALYLALIGYIPSMLALFHVQIAPEGWQLIENTLKLIIEILVFFGILMNPATKGFTDEQKEEEQ